MPVLVDTAVPDVIVVEDSESQRKLMVSILQGKGFEAFAACDGSEAVEMIKTRPPRLVVTDMQMPNMDGLQLIREMQERWPTIPSVLLTSFGSETLAVDALSAGAATYLSKDHMHIQLVDAVQRIKEFSIANNESLELKGVMATNSVDFVTDNSLERITPLVCLILRMLTSMNVLNTRGRIKIAEAVHFLLSHFIFHENLEQPVNDAPMSFSDMVDAAGSDNGSLNSEQSENRFVSVSVSLEKGSLSIKASHQGPQTLIQNCPLPGTPNSFSNERSRGMMLLTSVFDEVMLGKRNDITLVKKL